MRENRMDIGNLYDPLELFLPSHMGRTNFALKQTPN
jgi:hypothetical protein